MNPITLFAALSVGSLVLAACGAGGGGSIQQGLAIHGPCVTDRCDTPEEIEAAHEHNRHAIAKRLKAKARRLKMPEQQPEHASQAPVVAHEVLARDEFIVGTGGPSVDPDPNPGPSWLISGGSHATDEPDYLSVGVLPRRLGEWTAFNGFSKHRYNGKVFAPTSTTALSDRTTVQYGVDRGYPWVSTVERYLDAMGTDVNRAAVVRIREDATPEEIDLTVRAVQAINTALPIQHRIQVNPHPQPMGRVPGPNEITVAFAPIRQWPGFENTGPSSVIGVAIPTESATPSAEVYLRNEVIMRPNYPDHQRLATVIHELVHALGFWNHVEDGIGVSPEDGVYYGEGASLMEAGGEPGYPNGGVLYPIDRAALLAAFTNPDDLSVWSDETLQFHARLPLDGVPVDFGSSYRNGHANGWALGEIPEADLLDAEHVIGTVTWDGHLLGFTPLAQAVVGNAQLVIDLDILFGSVAFTELRHWDTGENPDFDTGVAWGDGDLKYAVEVRGNTFVQAGGRDPGTVTGAFFGPRHEGMGGVLERDDLVAGFGGRRPIPPTLDVTGSVSVHAPAPDVFPDLYWLGEPPTEPDWDILNGQPPAEPVANAPPEIWTEYELALAYWNVAVEREAQTASVWQDWYSAQQSITAAWRASQTYRSYAEWGYWAKLHGETLFAIGLHGDSASEGYFCPPNAECVPWGAHQLFVYTEGSSTGTNPIAGPATWAGYARAVSENGMPLEGKATLEADLSDGLIDVHLTELGTDSFSWTGLVMQDGAFSRIDEQERFGWTLGSFIEGTFYGQGHEGVAGSFKHYRTMGIFGALRETGQ